MPNGGLCYSINMKPHQTGEPWHPSCHGGKTPANLLFLEQPRALWARCGVQGFSPARPASRGTRRATAVKPGQLAFPRAAPRPMGAVWGAGHCPCLPPAFAEVGVAKTGRGLVFPLLAQAGQHQNNDRDQIGERLEDLLHTPVQTGNVEIENVQAAE